MKDNNVNTTNIAEEMPEEIPEKMSEETKKTIENEMPSEILTGSPKETQKDTDKETKKEPNEEAPLEFLEAVKSRAFVHDKTQCDIVFDYHFFSKEKFKGKKIKKISLDIKTYFFIPGSMGGVRNDMSSRDFQKNITNYQRLSFPTGNLTTPFQDHNIKSLDDILQKIKSDKESNGVKDSQSIKDIQDSQIDRCIQDIKIFSCLLEEELFSLIDSLGREAIELEQMEQLNSIKNRISFFRKKYVKEKENIKNKKLKQCIQFIDERLSFRLENILLALINHGTETPTALIREISDALNEEYQYRSNNLYLILSPNSSQTEKEYYGYRQSIIKKFAQDILYIEHNVQNKEKFHRNLIASIGAGMAATWAVIIELQRFRIMSMQDTSLNYVPLILIGVIAYIFKDRIKDLSKDFMMTKMSSILPDYKVKMKYSFIDAHGIRRRVGLGDFTETTRIEKINKIEKRVRKIREYSMLAMPEPSKREHIFSYKKHANLYIDNQHIIDSHLDSIKDTIRFDVSEFLRRLSNPEKTVRFFDGEKGFDITTMGRVYHLNIILTKTLKINGDSNINIKENYERYRLVINKKGIMRIEKVPLPLGL